MNPFITLFIITTGVLAIAAIIGRSFGLRLRCTATVWEYQTALHLHCGRLVGRLDAGRHSFWGIGHDILKFNTRPEQIAVDGDGLLTADQTMINVTAVLSYRITDVERMYHFTDDPFPTLETAVHLALFKVVGSETICDFLVNRSNYAARLAASIAPMADVIGVCIDQLEIRDIGLPRDLENAYNDALLAKIEARTRLERARGEVASLRTMANSSHVLQDNPALLQMRDLQTLEQISAGTHGNTIVLGKPEDMHLSQLKKS